MHSIYLWPNEGYVYTVARKVANEILYAEICDAKRLTELIQARKRKPIRVIAANPQDIKYLNSLVKDIKLSVSSVDYMPLREWSEEVVRFNTSDYKGPEEECIVPVKTTPIINTFFCVLVGALISLVVSYWLIVHPFFHIHSLSLDRRLDVASASLHYLEVNVVVTIVWDAILIHYPNSLIEHIEMDYSGVFSVIFLNPYEGLQVQEKYNFIDLQLQQGQRMQNLDGTVSFIYVLTGRSLW